MEQKMYQEIYDHISTLPVVSTHEHHLDDRDQSSLNLDGIFGYSYVAWLELAWGTTAEEHRAFLERAKYNSYFVWLERSLQQIYGFEGRITAENWNDISTAIRRRHSRDKNAHLDILKKQCRYKVAITDTFWDPISDLGHPDLFRPVVRSDPFISCFHPDVRDHDGNSAWQFFPGIDGLEFHDHVDYIVDIHRRGVTEKRAVAFKLAIAYGRTISIGNPSAEEASQAFLKNPEHVSEKDKLAFGDYIINRLCELAIELNVPYQVHVGFGSLAGSNPLNIESLIARYPKLRFVLFHGGYPWVHQVGALAHNHPNVSVDLVWLPLVSTTVAANTLHEFMEVVPSADRIAWGGDCWTSEESFGALLAFQHILAVVLTEKVQSRYMSLDDAYGFANRVMSQNALDTYNLK